MGHEGINIWFPKQELDMQHRNLASERVRLGFNQTDMASKLGVTIKQITRYENDLATMPADFVATAAEYFGCSADYLLDLTEDRLPKLSTNKQ